MIKIYKEERVFAPVIYDIHDVHDVLEGQYRKRIQFYKQCAYRVLVKGADGLYHQTGKQKVVEEEEEADEPPKPLFRSAPPKA
jgi:hypothetical protein